MLTVDVVLKPVVVNPSACFLDAVSFYLRNRILKTCKIVVSLIIKHSILWEMVKVNELRYHFVRVEPVIKVFGSLRGFRAVWIVCMGLKLLAVPNQQF